MNKIILNAASRGGEISCYPTPSKPTTIKWECATFSLLRVMMGSTPLRWWLNMIRPNREGNCVCLGRLVPPSDGWHDLCLRVYSVYGASPCIPSRAQDATICPKILIEYDWKEYRLWNVNYCKRYGVQQRVALILRVLLLNKILQCRVSLFRLFRLVIAHQNVTNFIEIFTSKAWA